MSVSSAAASACCPRGTSASHRGEFLLQLVTADDGGFEDLFARTAVVIRGFHLLARGGRRARSASGVP